MTNSATKNDDLVMTLVDEALARSESEREGFLRGACADDADLFEEVRSRVQLELRMNGFLLEPLFPRAEIERPFELGQLLAGRFRLVREVGHGGMGVVYEGIDEKLDRRIAIKCAKPGFQRRLPPEARSATEISHPNVCKMYEIHTAPTPYGELDFLTMEYLEGETLSERIRRQGRLPADQVRGIAQQLCAGLEEAHRNSVIHGDLKSSNIILIEDAGGGLRAVITDFGLARRTAGPPVAGLQGSQRGGTPDYMAPELWRGEKSSIASDLYALGVILYEALSGHPPFPDNTERRERLTQKPKQVGKVVPRIGRQMDRIVTRCLDPDPAHRPASAAEVSTTITSDQSSRRIAAAAAAVITVVVLAGIVDRNSIRPVKDPVRLAVLAFETPQEQKLLADGLLLETSKLLTKIKASGWSFSTIPVSESISRQVNTPERAHVLLGATHVLHGTVQQKGGLIIVRATVTDARSLQALKHQLPLEYTPTEVSRMPLALVGVVTGSLGLPPVKVAETVNGTAYHDYATGLAHLQHDSEVDDAVASLKRAVASDPHSAIAHAALAEAYRKKYKVTRESHYFDLAADATRRAEALNPDSAPVCLIAGLLKLDSGQYARAEKDFRRAIDLNPNDSDGYRRLALAYQRMDQHQEALAAHRKAIEVQPGYYRPYEELGGFYYDSAQYEQAAEQFIKVVELIPGWPESHFNLAVAYIKLGKFAEAEKESRIALNLNKNYVNALVTIGAALFYESRDAESIPYYKRALEITPNWYLPWSNLGDAYRRIHQAAEANRAYRKALELTRQEVLRNPQDAYVRAFTAYLFARLGESQQAEYEIAQSLALPATDEQARRMAVRTYEALGRREQTLSALRDARSTLIRDVGRNPDMADLHRDPRFIELLTDQKPQ